MFNLVQSFAVRNLKQRIIIQHLFHRRSLIINNINTLLKFKKFIKNSQNKKYLSTIILAFKNLCIDRKRSRAFLTKSCKIYLMRTYKLVCHIKMNWKNMLYVDTFPYNIFVARRETQCHLLPYWLLKYLNLIYTEH